MRTVVMLAAVMLLGGCVQSVQPFYTDEQLTYDSALAGTWTEAEGKNTLRVTGDPAKKMYSVAHTDEKQKSGYFVVHLAKVQGQMIADVVPAEPKLDENDAYKAHLLPLHSYFIVEQTTPELRLRTMNGEWLKKHLAQHPDAVAHSKADEARFILTGSTADVQAFILKHVTTEGAYGDPIVMKRVAEGKAAK